MILYYSYHENERQKGFDTVCCILIYNSHCRCLNLLVRFRKQQLQVTPKLNLASRNTAYAQKVLHEELQADRLKRGIWTNCEKEYIVETGSSSCPFLFGEIGDLVSVIPNHSEEKTRFKWLSIQIEHRWNVRMSKFTNSRPDIRIHNNAEIWL